MVRTEYLKHRRIVFVFYSSVLGGAERQGLLLARYLKEEEAACPVIFMLNAGSGRVIELCKRDGLEFHTLFNRDLNKLEQFIKRAIVYFFKPLYYLFVAGKIKQLGPDILLPYTLVPNLTAAYAWRRTGARACIWNQRDAGLGFMPDGFFKRVAHNASFFISNSVEGREYLINRFGVRQAEIAVINNGVLIETNASRQENDDDNYEFLQGKCYAIMVGHLHHNKDHLTLIKAWQEVVKGLGAGSESWLLLLAGSFDDRYKSLTGLTRQLNLEKQIVFLGAVRNVQAVLAHCDLYIHSSLSEGNPNAVLEAMAAGLPVVATRIRGNEAALGEENADYLAAPSDPLDLARKINLFIDHKALRQEVGKKNLKRINENFNYQKMGEKTVEIMKRFLPPVPCNGNDVEP